MGTIKMLLFGCIILMIFQAHAKKVGKKSTIWGSPAQGSQSKRNRIIKCCGRKSCFTGLTKRQLNASKPSTSSKSASSPSKSMGQPASPRTIAAHHTNFPEEGVVDNVSAPSQMTGGPSETETAVEESPATTLGSTRANLEDTAVETSSETIVPTTLSFQSQAATSGTTQAEQISSTTVSTTLSIAFTNNTNFTSNNASYQASNNSSSQLNASMSNSSSTSNSTNQMITNATTSSPEPSIYYIHPDCKPDEASLKNATLFDAKGVLKSPGKFGTWRLIGNESLVFGKRIGTWSDNRLWCLRLGMNPLTFTSKAETFKLWAATWNHVKRFWTFGKMFNESYGFCPNGTFGGLDWGPNVTNASDPSKACIMLQFTDVDKKLTPVLSKIGCSNKTYFACEGSITLPTPQPTYPQYTCTRNATLFTILADSKTLVLKEPDTHGIWHTYKARNYMFSAKTDKRSYYKSLEACCTIGAQLIDLNLDFIYENLVQIMKGDIDRLEADLFWTAGTDNGSEGTFGFANSKVILPTNAKWAAGQPDNSGGNENCLGVQLSGQSYAFKDENCDKLQRYICVSMDTIKSTTGGKQAQRECAITFGINENDIDSLMAAFISNGVASSNLKCYIKCMGDMTSLAIGENLNDAKFLRMLDAMAKDENDLDGKLNSYDVCSNIEGADECDRMAKVHKCGAQQSPEFVNNMIQATDITTPLKLSPLPSPTSTCPQISCILNEQKMLDFKNGTEPGTFYACNRKFYFPNVPSNIYPAVTSICCSYGLKLVSLKSLADFECLNEFLVNFPDNVYTTGVIRLGNISAPRNCFSDAPFDEKVYPWDNSAAAMADTTMFRVVFRRKLGAKFLQYQSAAPAKVLCEE